MEVDIGLPPMSPPPSSLGGFGLKRKLQAIFLAVRIEWISGCLCDPQADSDHDLAEIGRAHV